jgi:alkylhydroperoxidase family enzyme
MEQRYQKHTHLLVDAVLHGAGETSFELRQTVEKYAASLSGYSVENAEPVLSSLHSYITKVALHAYRITERDIDSLRIAGLSEDAIFELTLSAALGAGIARLQVGLKAMKEAKNAHQDT